MARLEGVRIKNFKALKDVTLGCLWPKAEKIEEPLSPLTVVIGKNGAGKSTFFEAFGFLADCLKFGVEEACDERGLGGFDKIRSQGQTGPIEFEIYYRENPDARPLTYELAIEVDEETERPFIFKERLRQRRKGQKHGRPFTFLMLNRGDGYVWKGEHEGVQVDEAENLFDVDTIEETTETERITLTDARKLGVATLGVLQQHPRIAAFRRFIEGWYLSYFTPAAARDLPLAGPQKHLNVLGDNLGNVVQFMEREHHERFQRILDRIAGKIPGVGHIRTEKSNDGRLLLQFHDKGFNTPFYAHQMSDGTLKVFAYLLLLEDPAPPPFLCIEEPENGLYHKLLEILAREFRDHAADLKKGSQIFVTTHQPYFVDALEPEEVWVLEKGDDGFSVVRRASEDDLVKNMVAEGLPLGSLRYSDYLDKR